jgi:uncharacterized RDD family membrane protein YckC
MTEQPYLSPYSEQVPPPQPGLYGKASGPRAGFWKRFGAALVDGIIVGVPTWIVIALVFGIKLKTQHANGTQSVSFSGKFFGESVFAGLVTLVYYALLDGGPRGQTLGKRVAGIRVVDAASGTSIGYARGLGRAAGKFVFNLLMNLCLVGILDYLWMLWDRENQTLHDKMVGSYVVPVEAYPIQ